MINSSQLFFSWNHLHGWLIKILGVCMHNLSVVLEWTTTVTWLDTGKFDRLKRRASIILPTQQTMTWNVAYPFKFLSKASQILLTVWILGTMNSIFQNIYCPYYNMYKTDLSNKMIKQLPAWTGSQVIQFGRIIVLANIEICISMGKLFHLKLHRVVSLAVVLWIKQQTQQLRQ